MEVLTFKEYDDINQLNEILGFRNKEKLKDMSDLDIVNIFEMMKTENYTYNNEDISYNDILNTIRNLSQSGQDKALRIAGWIAYIIKVYNINERSRQADKLRKGIERLVNRKILWSLGGIYKLDFIRVIYDNNFPREFNRLGIKAIEILGLGA